VSPRAARVTAWALAVASCASLLATVAAGEQGSVAEAVTAVLALGGLGVVGALVVGRDHRHRLGWLLCVASFCLCWAGLGSALLDRDPGGGADRALIAASVNLGWTTGLVLLILMGFIVPHGRLPSRRWRLAAWPGCAVAVAFVVGTVLSPLDHGVVNPIEVVGAAAFTHAIALLLLPVTALSVAAAVSRLRSRDPVERQQVKWIVAGFAAAIGVSAANSIAAAVIPGFSGMPQAVESLAWDLIPLSFGVAILRYRLYEIDVIIRRTLVYTFLIAVLAGVYLGAITGLGAASRAITGQSGTLAVTVSTLLVAAAFQPLRGRIQRGVDRRFYRGRYDAARTLEAFAGRLRDEVDVVAIGADVTGVVATSLQPAHVSLWLRPRIAP
jgi:hypothetical protein